MQKVTLYVTLVLCGCAPTSELEVPSRCDEVEFEHPSVGRITQYGGKPNCTAWAISTTHLVSTAHCVEKVRTRWEWKGYWVAPYAVHSLTDTVLFESLEGPVFEPLPFSLNYWDGEKVIGAGCSTDGGMVQEKWLEDDQQACGCYGDSGGPVMLGDEVTGVFHLMEHHHAHNRVIVRWVGLEHIVKHLPPDAELATK